MPALPSDYVPPAYLFEQLRRAVQGRRKGYIVLAGPAGAGKTVAMQALAEASDWNGAPVLAQFLAARPGLTGADLLDDLAAQIRARWPVVLPSTHSITIDFQPVPRLLPQVLRALMVARDLRSLVLIIDGLDDPRVSAETLANVTADLPAPHLLPDGCFVILPTAPEPQETVRKALDRLAGSIAPYPGGSSGTEELPLCFETITLDPASDAHRDRLRAYLTANLPEPFTTSDHVDTVLARADGLFLYASLACAGLRSGLFAAPDDLPDAATFYETYLARLREHVGAEAFAGIYEPLLGLLGAIALPATTRQFARWGVPAEALPAALEDLRGFLSVAEAAGGRRYSTSHGSFNAYLWQTYESTVQEAHGAIARAALAAITAGDDAEPDPYELAFAYHHAAVAAGDEDFADESDDELDDDFEDELDDALEAEFAREPEDELDGEAESDLEPEEELADDFDAALYGELTTALNAHALEYARACLRAAAPLVTAAEYSRALELYDLAADLASPGPRTTPDARTWYGEALVGQMVCSEALGQLDIAVGNLEMEEYPADQALAATEEDGDPALTLRHAELLDRTAAAHAAEQLHAEAYDFYLGAIVRYESLRERDPGAVSQETLTRARLNAGLAAGELGDVANALGQFDEAIAELASRPADAVPAALAAELQLQRGWALAGQDRLEDAIAALRTGLMVAEAAPDEAAPEVAPVAVRTLVQLGLVLERLPNQDEALATYSRAAALARGAAVGQAPEALAALQEASQALAGLLGRMGRFDEALAAADANIVAAAAVLERQPGSARVSEYFLTWFTKCTVLQMQGDPEQLTQGFADATAALRAPAEAGLPGAVNVWLTGEIDAIERLSLAGQFTGAEQHLATALQLAERIAAETPHTGNASRLLRIRTARAELEHRRGNTRRALTLVDEALDEYTHGLGFADARASSIYLTATLRVKGDLLEALDRGAEARAVRRRATRIQSESVFSSVLTPRGDQLAAGVRLVRGIGYATLVATDEQGGPPLATVALDHHAISSLRSDLRGWSGANWLNLERTLQVRSAGKERPIELTFQTLAGQELRRPLSDEESAALRTAIEELYEEGRVR